MNREHNILEITKSQIALDNFKGMEKNRPWLVDTETGILQRTKKWKFIYYRMYKLQTSTPYVKL